jgi:hypothetical protein
MKFHAIGVDHFEDGERAYGVINNKMVRLCMAESSSGNLFCLRAHSHQGKHYFGL